MPVIVLHRHQHRWKRCAFAPAWNANGMAKAATGHAAALSCGLSGWFSPWDARKGSAMPSGPSGCTNEHLRVMLDDEVAADLLARTEEKLAEVPSAVAEAARQGRLVPLTKPSCITSFDSPRGLLPANPCHKFPTMCF